MKSEAFGTYNAAIRFACNLMSLPWHVKLFGFALHGKIKESCTSDLAQLLT